MYNLMMLVIGPIDFLRDNWIKILIFIAGVIVGYLGLIYFINKGIERAIG